MVKPTYLRGRKPVRVKLHHVVEVLAMIDQHDQQDPFKEAAAASDAYVTIHPKTVNFVKDFLADHPKMKDHPLGARVITPGKRNDNYECEL